LRGWLNGEVVGLTGLGKTQSMIGLLCAVFEVMSCSSCTSSLLKNLPYYVL
jgi:hypothetical protein